MKKILSLVLALCMVLMVGSVFAGEVPAAEPQAEPGEFEHGEFTGGKDGTGPETKISATDLKPGDTVEIYQLVKWNDVSLGWVLNGECGVTLDELLNGITEAEATTIADTVTAALKVETVTVGESGSFTYDCTGKPGLFYLKAIPGENNKDTVYNPAFVSADYYKDGNTQSFSEKIGTSAVVKKSTVDFDKEVTGDDQFVDVKIGDEIPYKITTTIPSYGTTFTEPVFTITDTLSDGLTLKGDITVKYGDNETTETINKVVTITKGTPTNGFTVAFDKDYLTGLAGATPKVEITYTAEVTTKALDNATYMDNKAKLTFTNKPGFTVDRDDITRHYTFSLDANIAGVKHGRERSRELIKIGVDAAGETITAFTSWVEDEPWTEYATLEGAKFELVDAKGNKWNAESDADGYISFYGLDAGTYTLTETEAPQGYIRDTENHTVVITPEYTGENNDILEKYTVTIDGAKSIYLTNINDEDVVIETTINDDATTWPFVNTKGAELPHTGGIGTTIFYILGGLLVVGAAVILIARRKAQD